jgi:membrane fusion protein
MPRHSPTPTPQLGALPLPVVRPIPARALVAGVSAIAMATALFAYLVEVPRREHVQGQLAPAGGEIRIVAPYAGTVLELAAPGTRVAEGAALAVLRDSRFGGSGAVAAEQARVLTDNQGALAAEVETLQGEQRERERNLQRQMALARDVIAQARREGAVREEALRLSQAELARTAKLVESGFQSASRLEQMQAAVRLQEADMLAAQRGAAAAQAQLALLEAELQQSGSRTGLGMLEKRRQQADLRAQQSQTDSALRGALAAPLALTVLANAVTQGSTVSAGELVSVAAPQGAPLEAVLFIPARAAARLAPGQPVQLRLAAYPYEVFGPVEARITHVDAAPLRPDESAQLRQAPDGAAYVRARAQLAAAPLDKAGAALALASGMQFDASVEVERRTLLAWVMWPFLKQFN